MNQCKMCRSYAINLNKNGRDESDPDLCDVCFWRLRAEEYEVDIEQLHLDTARLRWLAGCSDGEPVIEGLACLHIDFWDYLDGVICDRIGDDESQSDEGTPDDRLAAFRKMIDDAIEAEKVRPA